MKITRIKFFGIATSLLLISVVSANSTLKYTPNYGSSLDYFWVPANTLLFHIDYPWDFVLYIFAIYGVYQFGKYMVSKIKIVLQKSEDKK